MTTHLLQDHTHDAQPQTRAAIALGDLVIGLGEILEDSLKMLRPHANTRVGHDDCHIDIGHAGLHGDYAILGELQGIGQQVDDNLLEAGLVAHAQAALR